MGRPRKYSDSVYTFIESHCESMSNREIADALDVPMDFVKRHRYEMKLPPKRGDRMVRKHVVFGEPLKRAIYREELRGNVLLRYREVI